MYNQSSSCSSVSGNSSQGSMSSSTTASGGLMRYGSAPSSLLNALVDSRDLGAKTRFFPSETIMPNLNNNQATNNLYPSGDGGGGGGGSLVRHSSSPAGFLNKLAAADNGLLVTKGITSYNNKGRNDDRQNLSRLNSQRSFTRQETLSRIFEENEGIDDIGRMNRENDERKNNNESSYSNTGFSIGSWDDTNQIMFAGSSSKRAKIVHSNGNGTDPLNSQFQFNMPEAALEMENFLHIPQDSIACKIRAKRGFATHPRSIAERERRTRISGKLKKLQDLVPNMDKQTSYSDMLDLAVHHIKSLQNHLQKLNHELEGCTCGCKNQISKDV